MLLIPMDDAGISVRPIIALDAEHHTNEVFFDDVRVPAENIIGEVNKGWTYAKALLGYERTEVARIGLSKRLLKVAKERAAERTVNGVPLAETPVFLRKLAAIEIELKAGDGHGLQALPGGQQEMTEAQWIRSVRRDHSRRQIREWRTPGSRRRMTNPYTTFDNSSLEPLKMVITRVAR